MAIADARWLLFWNKHLRIAMRDARGTQRSKILAELVAARGDWVPLYRVTQHAAQYNARIFELRRMGLRIANRTEDVSGVRHSWFRLERGPSEAISAPIATSPAENLSLFATPDGRRGL